MLHIRSGKQRIPLHVSTQPRPEELVLHRLERAQTVLETLRLVLSMWQFVAVYVTMDAGITDCMPSTATTVRQFRYYLQQTCQKRPHPEASISLT